MALFILLLPFALADLKQGIKWNFVSAPRAQATCIMVMIENIYIVHQKKPRTVEQKRVEKDYICDWINADRHNRMQKVSIKNQTEFKLKKRWC